MKYIFFGGEDSEFAEIVLQRLLSAGLEPIRAFRDAKASLNTKELSLLGADVFIVASFGKILKKEIIDIPKRGVIGVHPSLLPKYRGASPIQSVILNGEKETGVALFLIDEKVDHGPILATNNLQLTTDDNYLSLERKLAHLGADLIIEILPKWINGEIEPRIQDETKATFTKKFLSEDGLVDLKKDNPRDIWLKIRALNPEPGVYTILKLKNEKELRLKLLKAEIKNDRLDLKIVQPAGKKPMAYSDFLNGYKVDSIA